MKRRVKTRRFGPDGADCTGCWGGGTEAEPVMMDLAAFGTRDGGKPRSQCRACDVIRNRTYTQATRVKKMRNRMKRRVYWKKRGGERNRQRKATRVGKDGTLWCPPHNDGRGAYLAIEKFRAEERVAGVQYASACRECVKFNQKIGRELRRRKPKRERIA